MFGALAAAPIGDAVAAELPATADLPGLIALMRRYGNDLERPARCVLPRIADAAAALAAGEGCLHTQLCGAGPTCMGVFATGDAAERAARAVASEAPTWWVRACRIGEPAA